jgi:hypothetical protein
LFPWRRWPIHKKIWKERKREKFLKTFWTKWNTILR